MQPFAKSHELLNRTLRESEFAAIADVGGVTEDNLERGPVALDSDDFLLFDGTTLFYDADADDVGAAPQPILEFSPGGFTGLVADDFILI
ncbi:MAG: hypothetical protein AAGI34_01180 [Pseudomonadota bacterium]